MAPTQRPTYVNVVMKCVITPGLVTVTREQRIQRSHGSSPSRGLARLASQSTVVHSCENTLTAILWSFREVRVLLNDKGGKSYSTASRRRATNRQRLPVLAVAPQLARASAGVPPRNTSVIARQRGRHVDTIPPTSTARSVFKAVPFARTAAWCPASSKGQLSFGDA